MAISNKRLLAQNTFMLYLLQFSNYILSFITLPYQTRILGPENFGKVGVAMAVMMYVQLLIDFGFMLYATSEVARRSDDKKHIAEVMSKVLFAKIWLALCVVSIVLLIAPHVMMDRQDIIMYGFFIAATVIASLLPDYIYRGLERMTKITARTIIVKSSFIVLLVISVKQPDDYWLVPVLLFVVNIGAVLWAYVDLYRSYDIKLGVIDYRQIFMAMKHASGFFLSRIATTVYGATSTLIVSIISGGVVLGHYTAVDKISSTAKFAASPIADSLFPYMIKTKDYRTIKIILMSLMPIITAAGLIGFIFAEKICLLVLGQEYSAAANILRASIPGIMIALPLYLTGFPVLAAMGVTKHANYSVYSGVLVYIVVLCCLIYFRELTPVYIALTASLAEFVILLHRLIIIFLLRKGLYGKART